MRALFPFYRSGVGGDKHWNTYNYENWNALDQSSNYLDPKISRVKDTLCLAYILFLQEATYINNSLR